MKLTLLLIPLLFFMTSCTIDWNDEKDKKIAELEKQVQNEVFKKKEECMKYESSVKEKYSSDSNYYFSSIFYSKKYNSCLYRISRKTTGPYTHIIIDHLSGKEIVWKDDTCELNDNTCPERQKEFNDTLE